MNIIEIQNLSFNYRQGRLLEDLSLSIAPNSFWAMAGANGVGKSTLINLLTGLLKPLAGQILIEQKPLSCYSHNELAQKIAVVRQEFIPPFGYSVMETVLMARLGRRDFLLFENAADRQIAQQALEDTRTAHLARRPLNTLSGGERQRVFIARALAQQTPILLLDEPTSHLDLNHQVRIYDLLKQMQIQQNKTILAATHDINLACQYCDYALLLGPDGRFFTGPPEEVFTPQTINQVFGVRGFQAIVASQPFFLPLGKFAKDAGKQGL